MARVAVIVQCRLSSTRLPGKALKDLGGAPTLSWTLNAMKQVPAERYFLACDYNSENELRPVAERCGWEIFAGERDDVLERFCTLIETQFPECEIIVRATADNPFLFYEAAVLSVKEFTQNYSDADYFTFTGLPHGSGVELLKASSLLKARKLTALPYDHEHVGPSLYNHPENFKSIFAPIIGTPRYEEALCGGKTQIDFEVVNLADYRTTIDTYADYKRVQNIVQNISCGKQGAPYTAAQVLEAYKNPLLAKTILFVPSVASGRGTGHLRRCLNLAKEYNGFVYIPQNATLKETQTLVQEACAAGLNEYQIINDFTIEEMIAHQAKWDLVVADLFKSDMQTMQNLNALGNVCSIDDGGASCNCADYLLDIIPSYNLRREPNMQNPALIPVSVSRKSARFTASRIKEASSPCNTASGAKNAIVVVNDDVLAKKAVRALAENGFDVTVISKNFAEHSLAECDIHCVPRIPNLKDELYNYGLVFTYYGFTAFEAVAAGCNVVLAAITPLHKKLAKKYGFVCLAKNEICAAKIKRLLQNPERLTSEYFKNIFAATASMPNGKEGATALNAATSNHDSQWQPLLERLAAAQKWDCPVCKEKSGGVSTLLRGEKAQINFKAVKSPVARTPTHTFRRCPNCKMLYLAFSTDSRVQYEKSYFDSEYKNQYGRTYLEDFDSIKAQGVRRAAIISRIVATSKPKTLAASNAASIRSRASNTSAALSTPKGEGRNPDNCSLLTAHCLLDIGCAYGPFLAAAKDAGFEPYGSDISKSGIEYVKNTLGFKAVNASFAAFDAQKEFGFEHFDAITMWYVIEHIQNLGAVLEQVNQKLKRGGVFAFSTPSVSGVSARFNTKTFFEQSPRDHYSIWEIRNTQNILKRFGFKVKKIVSTGIHPERLPFIKKHNIQKGAFLFSLAVVFCKLFKLGDTYEVYCVKTADAKLGGV